MMYEPPMDGWTPEDEEDMTDQTDRAPLPQTFPTAVAPVERPVTAVSPAAVSSDPMTENAYRAAVLHGLSAIATKMERIVLAVEKMADGPSIPATSMGKVTWPTADPVAQMAQMAQNVPTGGPGGWVCPIHGAFKVIPAGISQKTHKAYPAFRVCAEQGCDQKAPRGMPA